MFNLPRPFQVSMHALRELKFTYCRKNERIQPLQRVVWTNLRLKLGLLSITDELPSDLYDQFGLKNPSRFLEQVAE
jgi:hypothetical protein